MQWNEIPYVNVIVFGQHTDKLRYQKSGKCQDSWYSYNPSNYGTKTQQATPENNPLTWIGRWQAY